MRLLFFLTLIATSLQSDPITLAPGAQSVLQSLDTAPVLHFTLARRGGKFAATEYAKDYVNLTLLAQELGKVEGRFNLTQRVIQGNRLVRKAKIESVPGSDQGALMGKIAEDGLWFVLYSKTRICAVMHKVNSFYTDTCNPRYATIRIGEPPQELEMDLNMLTSDFYVVITTSRKGKKYDDLFSQSIGKFFLNSDEAEADRSSTRKII